MYRSIAYKIMKTKERVRHTRKQYVNTLTKEVKSVECINGFIKPQCFTNILKNHKW